MSLSLPYQRLQIGHTSSSRVACVDDSKAREPRLPPRGFSQSEVLSLPCVKVFSLTNLFSTIDLAIFDNALGNEKRND